MQIAARFAHHQNCNMLTTRPFYFVISWTFIFFLATLTSLDAVAISESADGVVVLSASINQAPCAPDFQINVNDDRPVQLPKIASSNFKKNSLSAVSYFSIKLTSGPLANSTIQICRGVNLLNGIQFDTTPNATSVLGFVKNQAANKPAQNINVELILFNSNWTQQYAVNLQSKEAINFNKIPGWATDKAGNKVNQLNLAVRYTKDATATEEVTPGLFYVVLPFMLKFN